MTNEQLDDLLFKLDHARKLIHNDLHGTKKDDLRLIRVYNLLTRGADEIYKYLYEKED